MQGHAQKMSIYTKHGNHGTFYRYPGDERRNMTLISASTLTSFFNEAETMQNNYSKSAKLAYDKNKDSFYVLKKQIDTIHIKSLKSTTAKFLSVENYFTTLHVENKKLEDIDFLLALNILLKQSNNLINLEYYDGNIKIWCLMNAENYLQDIIIRSQDFRNCYIFPKFYRLHKLTKLHLERIKLKHKADELKLFKSLKFCQNLKFLTYLVLKCKHSSSMISFKGAWKINDLHEHRNYNFFKLFNLHHGLNMFIRYKFYGNFNKIFSRAVFNKIISHLTELEIYSLPIKIFCQTEVVENENIFRKKRRPLRGRTISHSSSDSHSSWSYSDGHEKDLGPNNNYF